MSRLPLLVLVLAVLLIAFGLSRGSGGADVAPLVQAGERPGGPESGAGRSAADRPPTPGDGLVDLTPKDDSRTGTVELHVRATESRTGGPAAGATIGLWRRATGEGPAYRSAKRLITPDPVTDERGELRIEAPRGVPLELVARTADGGPVTQKRLGPFDRGASARTTVELLLEPRPLPLDIEVLDHEGSPVPGAGLYVVGADPRRWVEFPTAGTIERRTDGDGRCVLDGAVRTGTWLAADAAGGAPFAIELETIGATQRALRIQLEPAIRAEVRVLDGEGAPVKGATVELRFELEGLAASRTGETDRNGLAVIRRLPPGVDVRPVVVSDGVEQQFAAVRFNREQREGGSQGAATVELGL